MKSTLAASLIALTWVAAGDAASASAAEEEAPSTAPGGVYEMSGVTIDKTTGIQRPIYGRIVLTISGDRYTTHFELSTLFPGMTARAAQVTGTGEGRVEGTRLVGEADTHLSLATAPGVDAGFAFVPRTVSPRIRSRSTAEIFPNGSVRAEIENEAVEGSGYAPTRTTLVGYPLREKR